MNAIMEYVKPDLVVLSVVLYLFGIGLKKSKEIDDRFIPIILGIFGVLLSTLYVVATSELDTAQHILLAVFTAIVQGILVTGLSTYVNQIIKQLGKGDDEQEGDNGDENN